MCVRLLGDKPWRDSLLGESRSALGWQGGAGSILGMGEVGGMALCGGMVLWGDIYC